MTDEIWKSVPGEPLLEVSTAGRVRILPRESIAGDITRMLPGRILREFKHPHGYARVRYIEAGVMHQPLVHRLIAKTFVPGEFDGATVDHIDGCVTNNSHANLQWVSLAENTRRQRAAGRGYRKAA